MMVSYVHSFLLLLLGILVFPCSPTWGAEQLAPQTPLPLATTLRETTHISSFLTLIEYGTTLYKLAQHPESDPAEVIEIASNKPIIQLPPEHDIRLAIQNLSSQFE
jgi:hypothetical protein